MIIIFKKIRERLIQTGKVQKYMLYAIGEILLVVVGILIALQVNNWNENRVLKNKEQMYLRLLLDEAEVNVSYISSQHDAFHENIEEIKKTAAYLANKKVPEGADSLFAINIERLGFYPSLTPFRSIYDEVVAAGILQIIQSDSIKFATNLFFSNADTFSEDLDFFRVTYDSPIDYALPHFKTIYDSTSWNLVRREADFNKLVENDLFISKVNSALRNMSVFQNRRRGMARNAEFMCNIIAREIGEECNPRYKRKYGD